MRKSIAPSQRIKRENNTTRNTTSVLNLLQTNLLNTDEKVYKPIDLDLGEKTASQSLQNSIAPEKKEESVVAGKNKNIDDIIFKVLWGKKTTKKHKTFEADGILKVTANSATLISDDGNVLGSSRLQNKDLLESGFQLCVGGKEVEIVDRFTETEVIISSKRSREPESHFAKRPKKSKLSFVCSTVPAQFCGKKTFFAGNPQLKPLVFPKPTDEYQWKKPELIGKLRDVTLDSFLTQTLRAHQREGILFLYECVMGYRGVDFIGAILADEMGLGKTLQCIALIWTLLKQGPYGTVICKKVLVVVPSSLCANWYNEFIKWLGRERLDPFVVDKSHKVSDFHKYNKSVMIISYEMFVRYYSEIEKNSFDLVVCDEGHKLKNSNIKASQLLNKMPCRRRILLTGTPLQNDLQEYFAIVDLVNPGILGTYSEFRRNYEGPILASQKPDCDDEEHAVGEEKAVLLNELTSKFILRRTQDVLEKYLPSKREFIVCCGMSQLQIQLYNVAIEEWENKENRVLPLQMISILKKICNFPLLLGRNSSECSLETKLADMIIAQNMNGFSLSGKLLVIETMLKNLVVNRREKIVLVSYSTRYLNILSDLCTSLHLQCLRLDGTTPVQKRQQVVNRFNLRGSGPTEAMVFLLSAKAGGVGLNLSGASRLVLVDSDWNPASDLQAAARVWRDGQKKGVFIYRLLCSGSIEEKVYQRQVSKTGLSDAVKNPENLKDTLKLSDGELKDLFTPNFECDSLTHDSLHCECDGSGICEKKDVTSTEDEDVAVNGSLAGETKTLPMMESINQLKHWQHYKSPFPQILLTDAGLDNLPGNLNFIFHKTHFT